MRIPALAGVVGIYAGLAFAQDYPTQPIPIVVPFSAGGPTDTVTRRRRTTSACRRRPRSTTTSGPVTDFGPVGLVTNVPMTIIARKGFERNTLAELVTCVKAKADTVRMANAGIGAASHPCGMPFMDAIDTPPSSAPRRSPRTRRPRRR